MKKLIGFIVCTLLITATSFSVVGIDENRDSLNEDYVSYNSELSKPLNRVDEWPMFRHDLNHTGYSTSSTPDTVELLWSFSVSETLNATFAEISSSPAVVDGKIYFGTFEYYEGQPCGKVEGGVFCLDALNGEELWYHRTGGEIYLSSPAVIDGKVYVGVFDMKTYCLNADDGEELWNYTIAGYVTSSPAVVNGKVYIGSYDDKVYCLDATTGTKLWEYTTNSNVSSSPAINNEKVYIGSNDGKVYCLDADTGDKLWDYNTSSGYYAPSSPAVVNGKVYIGSYNNKVYCLDADTGEKLWDYTTGDRVCSSPAVADGKVYIGSDDSKAYCLDADTGDFIWSYTTGDFVWSSPAVADGKVYIGSDDNKVYCLDADNGTKLWDYTTDSLVYSSPAVADGRVYIGSLDGRLYAFGEPNNPPDTPIIDGPTEGTAGEQYTYEVCSTDPEGDDIVYCIDFGDDTGEVCVGPFPSGTCVSVDHTWTEEGAYTVKVKATDIYGAESDWATLEVEMPVNQHSYSFPLLQRLLEQFPNAFPILRYLLGL